MTKYAVKITSIVYGKKRISYYGKQLRPYHHLYNSFKPFTERQEAEDWITERINAENWEGSDFEVVEL